MSDRLARWTHCAGCPRMAGCAYGELFEPDPPAGLRPAPGWEAGARPIVFAPAFPAPDRGRPGDEIDLRVVAIGPAAAAHLDAAWEALRVAGADLAIGLGDDRIPFDVRRDGPATGDVAVTLPAAEPAGVVPLVRVELTSPLFLAETDGAGRRRAVTSPTLAQLVRAGLRTLGPLHRLYGAPLPDGAFAAVKAAAKGLPTRRARFAPFRQGRHSTRTGDRYEAAGVTGWAEYGPAPAWLVPWLAWAGRVHAGTHRVAGAGGWQVTAGTVG